MPYPPTTILLNSIIKRHVIENISIDREQNEVNAAENDLWEFEKYAKGFKHII